MKTQNDIAVQTNGLPSSILVFDLNGTLCERVSNHPLHLAYRNQYIAKKLKKTIGKELPEGTSMALRTCGLDISDYYNTRNKELDWNLFHTYNPHIFKRMQELKRLGFKLCIYTDCRKEQVEATLSILRIKQFIDLIVTEEFQFKKPNPAAFNYIASKFGTLPKFLTMIADNWEQDLLPLHILGGNTIWIKNHHNFDQIMPYIKAYSKAERGVYC